MPWHLPLWLLSPSDLAFRRWRLELWHDTALSCGLRVVDSSSQRAQRLKVEARAGPVTVRIAAPGNPQSGVRVLLVFPWPHSSSVRIRLASMPPWTRDLASGDELFDGAFSLQGPEPLLIALLDAEMRRLLLRAKAESRLEISRGELRMETRDQDLSDVLPLLLDISRRLAERIESAQRLAENARRDPLPGVRLRNLLVLAREFPEAPETAEALRAACSDAIPQVRLRAALKLGPRQGHDVLVELAESPEDEIAAQALSHLQSVPFERVQAILSGALRRRRLQTARVCLEALGHCEYDAAVDMLAQVLAREQGELAAVAARALGETGSPAAEAALLRALQRDAADLQVAAANALARAGTAAAVLPLQEAAERSPNNQGLQRATRQAIAEIKSRLPGASPGQLSLAGIEAGQLSLAPSEAGRLSLAPSEPGQLSLATDPAGQLSLPPGDRQT